MADFVANLVDGRFVVDMGWNPSLIPQVVAAEAAAAAAAASEAATADKVSLTALAASTGAALVGWIRTATGAIPRLLSAKLADIVDVRDFGVVGSGDEGAKIIAAINYAVSIGAELIWPGGSYSSSVAIVTGPVRIRCTGPVVLTYSSATHIAAFLNVDMQGVDTYILGKLRVDANSKANEAIRIGNLSATRADLTLGDVEGRNGRMVTGNGFNAGASGVKIYGNIDTLKADRLFANTVSRAAGSGSAGNYGTAGVAINTSGGYAPKVIHVGILGAKDISTDDAPGAAARVDVDGVTAFQLDEEGASCQIRLVSVVNAAGRGFKGQNYRACRIEQVSVHRSVESITGGAPDVAYQYGEGSIGQISITYSGDADLVHLRNTVCVSFYTATVRASGYGVASIQNLTVRDATTGTATIYAMTNLANASASTLEMFGSVQNVRMIGRTAQALVDIGNNGSAAGGKYNLRVDGFVGGLTTTAIWGGTAAKTQLRALFTGVWNTGSEVASIKRDDAVSLGNSFGKLVDGGGNVGIKKQTGRDDTPGLFGEQQTVGSYTNNSQVAGFAFVFNRVLLAGEEAETPIFGGVSGSARLWAGSTDFGPPGEFTTPGSSNTITQVQSASGFVVGSGGVDPGSGSIRMWKSTGGTKLTVRNSTATDRYVLVLALG